MQASDFPIGTDWDRTLNHSANGLDHSPFSFFGRVCVKPMWASCCISRRALWCRWRRQRVTKGPRS